MEWRILTPSLVIVMAAGLFLVTNPDTAAGTAAQAMDFVTGQFGWLFVLTGAGAVVFALWLAFGRYSHVKLGDADEAPEYSEISWAAMMFCAGIGIGLLSWAFVEPMFYFISPPMHITAGTSVAAEWAHMYAQFHWGFVPWCIYAIPAVPVAYALYVRKTPCLRISVASEGVLRRPWTRRFEPLIDTLVIVGIIGGAGTSMGLGVPLVSAFTSALFGFEESLALQLAVLAFWTLLFSVSVYQGLKAGIQILSDINIFLAVFVVLFILLAGPTVFILTLSANSFGLMLDNFVRMSFWLDPIDNGSFPKDWTLFYWAWWIAYAPLMGLFFGRISRGRTIRHMVLGIIGWGTLGCLSFMAVCGGYSLYLELNGILNVAEILQTQGSEQAVVAIIETLPMSWLALLVITILAFIFLATTLDSVAYVLASITSKSLAGDEEPARANRLLWAFALAFIAVGLLVVGGLKTVQSASVVTALPLIPVIVVLTCSMLVWLKEDFGAQAAPKVLVRPDAADR